MSVEGFSGLRFANQATASRTAPAPLTEASPSSEGFSSSTGYKNLKRSYPISPSPSAGDDFSSSLENSSFSLASSTSLPPLVTPYQRKGSLSRRSSAVTSATNSPFLPSHTKLALVQEATNTWEGQIKTPPSSEIDMPYNDTLFGSDQTSTTTGPYVSNSLYSHSMTAPSWNMAFLGGNLHAVPSSGVISGTLGGEDNQLYSTAGYSDSTGILGSNIGWAVSHNTSSSQQPRGIYSHDQEAPRVGSDYALHHVLRAPILPSSGQLRRDSLRRRGSSSTIGASSDSSKRARIRKTARDSRANGFVSEESLSAAAGLAGKDKLRPGDRNTHNDVERKYRMNLKDKIAELKAAVPSLQSASEGDSDNGGESTGSAKFSKGTILSRATEYIHQLEQVNSVIASQHHDLVQRMRDMEALLQESGVVYHQQQQTVQFDQVVPRGFQ